MICGLIGGYTAPCGTWTRLLGKRPGVADYYAMNLTDPAAADDLPLRYGREPGSDPGAAGRNDTARLAGNPALRVDAQGGAGRTRFRQQRGAHGGQMRRQSSYPRGAARARGQGEMQADAALSEEVRLRAFPSSAPQGRGQPAGDAGVSTPEHPFNLLKWWAAPGSPSGPFSWAPGMACTSSPSGDRAPDREHDCARVVGRAGPGEAARERDRHSREAGGAEASKGRVLRLPRALPEPATIGVCAPSGSRG